MKKEKEIKITKEEQKLFGELSEIREERSRLIKVLSRISQEHDSRGVIIWDKLIRKYKLDPEMRGWYDSDTGKIYQKEQPIWYKAEEDKEKKEHDELLEKYTEFNKEMKRQNDLIEKFNLEKRKE